LRGYTLASFAKKIKMPYSTVWPAARGKRSGIRAVRALKKLEEFINA